MTVMTSEIRTKSDSSGISLAVRLQRDSDAAWSDLVELYGPLVHVWGCRLGLDESSAEDLTQEVFRRVLQGIDKFDLRHKKVTFRGWLWRITQNIVIDQQRRPTIAPRGGSSAAAALHKVADPFSADEESEPPTSPGETASLIRRAMKQIQSQVEPTTWEAFERTTIGGESSIDVADELGLTPAAVRKAKSRTLQRLRKQLGDLW